jgi:hypothetical protein
MPRLWWFDSANRCTGSGMSYDVPVTRAARVYRQGLRSVRETPGDRCRVTHDFFSLDFLFPVTFSSFYDWATNTLISLIFKRGIIDVGAPKLA